MNKYIELTTGEKIDRCKLVYLDKKGLARSSKAKNWKKRINGRPLILGVSTKHTEKGNKVVILIQGIMEDNGEGKGK